MKQFLSTLLMLFSVPALAEITSVTPGTEAYRGFRRDDVLHSHEGDIHYHIHIPESYDASVPFALFVTLPGYEGLYTCWT